MKRFIRFSILFVSLVWMLPGIASVNSDVPITGTSYINLDQFDQKFITFMKKWHMPGASVTIMRDGKILAMRGYGWADVENRQPVQPNSLFRIASASKTFTAVSILKLIQDGKLNLNDKVFSILNDVTPLDPNKKVDPRLYNMTVQNLLQMSSGWFAPGSGHLDPMFGPWPPYMTSRLSPELPASCLTTMRFMMNRPLRYAPGTQYVYSNLDYCMLGLIVNKVTGTPYGYKGYENFVRGSVLGPIHITNMAIGSTQWKYRLPGEVRYYLDARGAGPEELKNSSYLPYSDTELLRKNFGNGGWVATSADLATFVQALKHHQVLNEHYLTVMQTKPGFLHDGKNPRARYYTMGGIMLHQQNGTFWVQTGSFTGTNAYVLSKPDDTTIAVIFNSRPAIFGFLGKFRPELHQLFMNAKV